MSEPVRIQEQNRPIAPRALAELAAGKPITGVARKHLVKPDTLMDWAKRGVRIGGRVLAPIELKQRRSPMRLKSRQRRLERELRFEIIADMRAREPAAWLCSPRATYTWRHIGIQLGLSRSGLRLIWNWGRP